MALDTLGIGLIWPILQGLVRDLGGGDHLALHVGLLMALYAAMQFVFAPLLGVLSDRFGRRPVLWWPWVGRRSIILPWPSRRR